MAWLEKNGKGDRREIAKAKEKINGAAETPAVLYDPGALTNESRGGGWGKRGHSWRCLDFGKEKGS